MHNLWVTPDPELISKPFVLQCSDDAKFDIEIVLQIMPTHDFYAALKSFVKQCSRPFSSCDCHFESRCGGPLAQRRATARRAASRGRAPARLRHDEGKEAGEGGGWEKRIAGARCRTSTTPADETPRVDPLLNSSFYP